MKNAFTKKELKKLKTSLEKMDDIENVTINKYEPFQKLKVTYIHKDLGKMSFEIGSAEAFDTFEELEEACKSYITKACVWDE